MCTETLTRTRWCGGSGMDRGGGAGVQTGRLPTDTTTSRRASETPMPLVRTHLVRTAEWSEARAGPSLQMMHTVVGPCMTVTARERRP